MFYNNDEINEISKPCEVNDFLGAKIEDNCQDAAYFRGLRL